MGLRSLVIPAEDINELQAQSMLRIMQTFYLNVSSQQFRNDLKEKNQVILLHEKGTIHGFSAWMLTHYQIEKKQVNIIFSGDTIIEKDYWHSMALPIAWGKLMLSVLSEHPGDDLYWLLTSKGYKTYRFLPIFFREFYPSYAGNTPAFEKKLLASFARYKFGDRFNSQAGVLTAPEDAQKLIPGVADINGMRRKDPHVVFFEKMNPGYTRGNELVCLVRCHPDNIKPFILRHIQS